MPDGRAVVARTERTTRWWSPASGPNWRIFVPVQMRRLPPTAPVDRAGRSTLPAKPESSSGAAIR